MKRIENSSIELRVHEAVSMARLLGVSLPAKASDAEVLGLLGDALEVMARRDWDVRVLDAHLATGGEVDIAEIGDGRAKSGQWDIEIHDASGQFTHAFTEPTPDAARHAAALAVLPTLDPDKRAELGECP